MEENGLIGSSGEDPISYLSTRDIETITIASVIETIRHVEVVSLVEYEQQLELIMVGERMRRVVGAKR